MTIPDLPRIVVRLILGVLFGMSILYWISVAFYCIYGYVSAGADGVRDWLLHVAVRPTATGALPSAPNWTVVALRFVAIAALTVMLWLANRAMLKQLSSDFRAYIRLLRHPSV